MIHYIVASHGRLCEELVLSSFMVFGNVDFVSTVTFLPGEGPDDLREKYRNIIDALPPSTAVVFLADVWGGSPFNVAAMLTSADKRFSLVAGVNLMMLIEGYGFSTYDDAHVVATHLADAGLQSIKKLEVVVNEEELAEDEL